MSTGARGRHYVLLIHRLHWKITISSGLCFSSIRLEYSPEYLVKFFSYDCKLCWMEICVLRRMIYKLIMWSYGEWFIGECCAYTTVFNPSAYGFHLHVLQCVTHASLRAVLHKLILFRGRSTSMRLIFADWRHASDGMSFCACLNSQ